MNILHHSSSFRCKLEFALAVLLAPVAALAAPPAAAPAAATTKNKSLSSLLDNSPYVPADYVPYQPAAPVAKPTVAPTLTLQYKGYSQEGDVTYYIIADTRSGQSHWLKTGETWYLPNGGYVQLTAADGESIMLDTSNQQGVVIGLYHDASKPVASAPTNTPTVVLSTDTGSPRGGKDNTSPTASPDPGNGPGPGFNGGGRGGRGNGPGNGGGFNGPGNGGPGGGFNGNRGGFNGPGNGPSGGNNAAAGGNGG